MRAHTAGRWVVALAAAMLGVGATPHTTARADPPSVAQSARPSEALGVYPPWQHGRNNDAGRRGLEFTVPEVDDLADFHGDPFHAKLVLYVGGNYFFAMAALARTFEAQHPSFRGRLYWETLPPGLLAQQMRAGGAVTVGNMTWTAKPDLYLAGLERVRQEIRAGALEPPAVAYVTNTLTLMVRAGNPAHVRGLADLARPDLRLAMPNPRFEGIARQIEASLLKAGGPALLDAVYVAKVRSGGTLLTRIHHRQTPLWILEGKVQCGVTWLSEARFQELIGHPIGHVAIAPAENTTAIYAGAVVKGSRHARAARLWLAFLRSPAALAIFERYGFAPYVSAAHADGPARRASSIPAAPTSASVAVCAACHGADGQGVASLPASPYLAGLPADYLVRQLHALADGSRRGGAMSVIARTLTVAEVRAAATYFAMRPRPALHGRATRPSTLGRRLAQHGRWSQGLPACELCHGHGGLGVGSAFPPLAGQSAIYLAEQLRAFQQGARPPGPLGLMRVVARKLSDADIRAVADYFSSLSPATAMPIESSGLQSLPRGAFGEVVRQGERIFEDPSRYAPAYVGNRLRCSNCHLDAGRLAGSAPLWAAFVSYPAYRSKNHHVNTLAERLQGCFRYSMNGKAPPLGDPVLVALESYAYWLARGMRVDPHIPGRGYPKIPEPPLAPDYARGRRVYAEHCALCHRADGAGQSAGDGRMAFPPLWGPGSFNWGAGMASLKNAAPFIRADMPLGLGGTLTVQQAWDVALYVDGHERPQDPRFTGWVAETRTRYHDSRESMYGEVVAGYLLGSERRDR